MILPLSRSLLDSELVLVSIHVLKVRLIPGFQESLVALWIRGLLPAALRDRQYHSKSQTRSLEMMSGKGKSVGPAFRLLNESPAVVWNENPIGPLQMIRSSGEYSQGDGLSFVKEY